TINSPMNSLALAVYQVAVIAILDLPGIARSFSAKAGAIAAAPFADAARSSGADRCWVAAKHVAPFLADDFLEALPVQAISAASTIAKLGLFSLFIGGTRMSFDPPLLQPSRMELVGLMGYNNAAIMGTPWLFLGPFAGWFLVFVSAELLASGLRDRHGPSGPHAIFGA
ncbi:MAG: hypothetical protein Q8M76_19030, partial [Spirochaetaceae bacterium]|nr:hypothetical protein [Spirochaetaceae bacterium]